MGEIKTSKSSEIGFCSNLFLINSLDALHTMGKCAVIFYEIECDLKTHAIPMNMVHTKNNYHHLQM